MNSKFTIPTPTVAPANAAPTLVREIKLDRVRAALWQRNLEQLPSASSGQGAVAHFHQHLGDACWLARWNRENVRFDLELTLIPDLLNELLAEASHAQGDYEQAVVEDIVATLTRAN